MRVSEIWRYPVKSVGGERLDAVELSALGIPHDRAWGIVDLATGNVLTGRREPALLMAAASVVDGVVHLTGPDGSLVADDEALTRWLGRSVSLASAGSEGGTYEDATDAEHDTGWVSWQGPGGAWHDSGDARVSMVSTDTLGDDDRRRFRMNLVMEGAGEDELVGSRVAIGDAVLVVTRRIPRCVMVTRPQPGLPRDLDVLRRARAERDGTIGVGLLVDIGGTVRVGDPVVR